MKLALSFAIVTALFFVSPDTFASSANRGAPVQAAKAPQPAPPAEDLNHDDWSVDQIPNGTTLTLPVNITIAPRENAVYGLLHYGAIECDIQLASSNDTEILSGSLELEIWGRPETHVEGDAYDAASYQAFFDVRAKLNGNDIPVGSFNCMVEKPLKQVVRDGNMTLGQMRAAVLAASGSFRVPAPIPYN